jgi:hypothetical protein
VTWAPAEAEAAGPKAVAGGKKKAAKAQSGHRTGVRCRTLGQVPQPRLSSSLFSLPRPVCRRCVLKFPAAVTSLCWHRKGDYLATAVPGADTGNVMVHQVKGISPMRVFFSLLTLVPFLSPPLFSLFS